MCDAPRGCTTVPQDSIAVLLQRGMAPGYVSGVCIKCVCRRRDGVTIQKRKMRIGVRGGLLDGEGSGDRE